MRLSEWATIDNGRSPAYMASTSVRRPSEAANPAWKRECGDPFMIVDELGATEFEFLE
jgi:hypothetical protein